jgi:hypothetical protein
MHRAGGFADEVAYYANAVCERQQADGGWPASIGDAASDYSCTAYAIELLMALDPEANAQRIHHARQWFESVECPGGGWIHGLFDGAPWERAWTVGYLVQRLAVGGVLKTPIWQSLVRRAVEAMLADANALSYSDNLQRWRVEARIAAGLQAAIRAGIPPAPLLLAASLWLDRWRDRAVDVATRLRDADVDLATATFLIAGLRQG